MRSIPLALLHYGWTELSTAYPSILCSHMIQKRTLEEDYIITKKVREGRTSIIPVGTVRMLLERLVAMCAGMHRCTELYSFAHSQLPCAAIGKVSILYVFNFAHYMYVLALDTYLGKRALRPKLRTERLSIETEKGICANFLFFPLLIRKDIHVIVQAECQMHKNWGYFPLTRKTRNLTLFLVHSLITLQKFM